jgi:GNAT superfamily N-acetyltransferase
VIRTASPADLPALRVLFAAANDAPYDLAGVTGEKCFGPGIAGAPVTRVFSQNGRLVGAAVTCGKWLRILAVDREFRRQGIGSALLKDAEALGAQVIAAEPGNYFTPGVIDGGFFVKRGYAETAKTRNLEVDLSGFAASESGGRATALQQDRVLSFIEHEFGRIWRFEASKAFDREEPTLFIEEHDGEIAGFAAHDVNNRGLGFFGPTGVKKSLRGKGIGCRLLLASLADLHRLGYEKAIIPWTDALAFYAKCCGAEPAHHFIALHSRREID